MKKLIEVALPLEAINEAASREKSIRQGHPSTIHLWWSRKPLAAARAVLFASLVDDPGAHPDRFPTLKAQEDERHRLFAIIQDLVKWENLTNDAVLERARVEIRGSAGGGSIPVLDPFCGGGSIPLEAQRLGLTAIASDLNPVAVLITKALVEIPPRFADRAPVHPGAGGATGTSGSWRRAAGLAEDVRRYGEWMRSEALRRLGGFYRPVRVPSHLGSGEAKVIAWLWTRTVTCPNPACRIEMPLLTTFVLSSKTGNEAYLVPVVSGGRVTFQVATLPPAWMTDPKAGYKRGTSGIFECAQCGTVTSRDYVAAEGLARRLGVALRAVVVEINGKRAYVPPTEVVEPDLTDADLEGLTAELAANPRDVWCRNFGLTTPADLFTPRQIAMLGTFADLVSVTRERILADAEAKDLPADERPLRTGGSGAIAYADAVSTYLGLAVSRLADNSSALTMWSQSRDQIVHTFGRQALPMVWDFAEANPFAGAAGDLTVTLEGVAKSIENLPASIEGSVRQADATQAIATAIAPLISTDPPYYDNIGYADLADFFYVWLRRSLSPVFPDLFHTVLSPKADELTATAYRFGGDKRQADRHFEAGLRAAFARMREMTDPALPVTVYYAFKQAESDSDEGTDVASRVSTGWESMLEALLGVGFAITGTWPMRTERSGRMRAIGNNALASSIILVCRARPFDAGITDRRGFVAALKADLPSALRTLQHGSIAPVDLAQASIGPGMATFSRYSRVVEPDGGSMTVRTALSLINRELTEILTEFEEDFDSDTRWATTWYEQFGHADGDFGTAEILSKAKNTGVDALRVAGIVVASGGKVRLRRRGELDRDWNPATDRRLTVWEITQHLIRTLDEDGESATADLVRNVGGLADAARDLAYRLYSIAERKKWVEEALGYNALVTAWPEITRLAASNSSSESPQQTQLFS